MKYLPKWLRIFIATWKVKRMDEFSGQMYDATKPEMELVIEWTDDKGLEDAWALLENQIDSGRDFVYLGAVRTGPTTGYMFVHSPKDLMWIRGFIPGIYEPMDAYTDALNKAKSEGKALGFRMEHK